MNRKENDSNIISYFQKKTLVIYIRKKNLATIISPHIEQLLTKSSPNRGNGPGARGKANLIIFLASVPKKYFSKKSRFFLPINLIHFFSLRNKYK